MGDDESDHDDNKRTQKEFQRVMFRSLCAMHSCNLLFYSRNSESADLSRKLRPEFNRIFLASDINEALQILANTEMCRIDMIIADGDVLSLKLLEAVNLRPISAATSSFPLVATVILLPSTSEQELLLHDSFSSIGAGAIVQSPYNVAGVMQAIHQVLRRRQLVEKSYRELRDPIKLKYPHLPIFPVTINKVASTVDGDSLVHEESTAVEELDMSVDSHMTSVDVEFDEVDDWTNCSSLIPDNIQKIRDEVVERVDIKKMLLSSKKHNNNNDDDTASSVSEKGLLEAMNRHIIDEEIMLQLNDDCRNPGRVPSDMSVILSPSLRRDGKELKIGEIKKMVGKFDNLLDECNRPSSGAAGGERRVAPPISLRQLHHNPKTVVGLEKKPSTAYWLMESHTMTPTEKNKPNTTPGSPMSEKRNVTSLSMAKSSSNKTLSISVTPKKRPNTAQTTTGKTLQSPGLTLKVPGSGLQRQTSSVSNYSSSSCVSKMHSRETSVGNSRKESQVGAFSNPALKQKEKRYLARVAKRTQIETQFSNLLEVELNTVQLPNYERTMLRQGRNHEFVEEYDAAINYFERVLKCTKKPYVANTFLGGALYKKGLYFEALSAYSAALVKDDFATAGDSFNSSQPVVRPVKHVFVATFNRSLVYFRLCNDSEGLKDLRAAVALQPNDYEVLEVLSTVLTRIGRFKESMHVMEAARKMKLEQEEEEKYNNMLQSTSEAVDSSELEALLDSESVSMEKPVEKKEEVPAPVVHRRPTLNRGNSQTDVTNNLSRPTGLVGGRRTINMGNMHERLDLRTELAGRRSINAGVGVADQARQGRSSMISTQGGRSSMISRGNLHSFPSFDAENSVGFYEKATKLNFIDNMRLSMNDRKIQMLRESDSSFCETDKQTLDSFRTANGMQGTLFEMACSKLDATREALSTPPGKRSPEQCSVIVHSVFGLIPFFKAKSIPVNKLKDIANAIEYRVTTQSDTEIFKQNNHVDAFGIVMKGSVQKFMETASKIDSFLLGELHPYESFCHIDILFRRNMDHGEDVSTHFHLCDVVSSAVASIVSEGTSASSSFKYGELAAANHHHHHHHHHHHRHHHAPTHIGRILNRGNTNLVPIDVNAFSTIEDSKSSVTEVKSELEFVKENSQISNKNVNDILNSSSNHVHDFAGNGSREGIFSSYVAPTIGTEILMLKYEDFERFHLRSAAQDEFSVRMDALSACRIFSSWPNTNIIQLARMSRIQHHVAGSVLLDQGDVPLHIYIMLKGMCKVYKKPNNVDVLFQKLSKLKIVAEEYDVKFRYHNKLRNAVGEACPAAVPFEKGTYQHTTQHEADRYELEKEINRLDALVTRLQMEAALSGKSIDSSASVADTPDFEKEHGMEVRTIQWPMLFGEACLLSPHEDRGMSDNFSRGGDALSAGKFIADTACVVLSLHKSQLQTFKIDDAFLSKVKKFSVVYPKVCE